MRKVLHFRTFRAFRVSLVFVVSALFLPLDGAVADTSNGAPKTTVQISDADCKRLVRHMPSGDVAFKPGVDVRGNPVAGADLASDSVIKLPDSISFDLTIDVLEYAGISSDSPLSPIGEAKLGKVEYNLLSGKTTFNGQEIGDSEQALLAEACRSAHQ